MTEEAQSAADVLMIRPVRFAGNLQTRGVESLSGPRRRHFGGRAQAAALREFEVLAAALRAAGVNVHAFDDTPQPHTPDSIFPNNWVSFHADGTVVLYPMLADESTAGAPRRICSKR